MRTYEDVWKKLKERKSLKVTCPIPMQPRLRQAVFKEKDKDEDRKKFRMEVRQDEKDKTILNFRLRKRINLLEI